MFIGRPDAKAETLILWPPHAKNWLIGKDPDARRDWGQEEKGTIEDEMAGWHHQLDGHELEYTLEVGYGQRGLACCDLWGRKESDTTEWLNWTESLTNPWYQYILFLACGTTLQLSCFKSWKMMLWKCCAQMPPNLENSAVATRLEKVSFHSNSKERQCQRMLRLPHNCTHLTC